MHGSYNWTIKAKYNNETVSIIESKDSAEQFEMEFNRIKREIKET